MDENTALCLAHLNTEIEELKAKQHNDRYLLHWHFHPAQQLVLFQCDVVPDPIKVDEHTSYDDIFCDLVRVLQRIGPQTKGWKSIEISRSELHPYSLWRRILYYLAHFLTP
jgi:hypothetical protein|tara:strand:- start:1058 stop:1390 length:333 start_codon:yes stop_codon:yes gene_type:complete